MKIGLLADIHENVIGLRRALDMLIEMGCEKLYCLGDILRASPGDRKRDAHGCVSLLQEYKVTTIVGNHDLEGIRKLPQIIPSGWDMPENWFDLSVYEQTLLAKPGKGEHPKGLWWVGRDSMPPFISPEDVAWLESLPETIVDELGRWSCAMMHWFWPNPTGYAIIYPNPRVLEIHAEWQKERGVNLVFSGHDSCAGLMWFASGDSQVNHWPFNKPLVVDREKYTWISLPGIQAGRVPNGVAVFDTELGTVTALPLGDGDPTAAIGWAGAKNSSKAEIYIDTDARSMKGTRFHVTIRGRNQFAVAGQWLRGSMHCHFAGDSAYVGSGDQRNLKDPDRHKFWIELYKNIGLDFVAATDHSELWRGPTEDDGMLIVPGIEMNRPHVIVLGISKPLPDGECGGKGIAEKVEQAKQQGGLVILPHASLTTLSWQDMEIAGEAGLGGFEVAHAKGLFINGRHRSDQLWYMLLEQGHRPAAIGSDDAHFLKDDIFGEVAAARAWTGLLVTQRSVRGILDAIKDRRTYASEGPELLDIRVEDNEFIIECSPCKSCFLVSSGSGIYYSHILDDDQPAQSRFTFDLPTHSIRMRDWVSVVIEDAQSRRAWSSPIDLELNLVRK